MLLIKKLQSADDIATLDNTSTPERHLFAIFYNDNRDCTVNLLQPPAPQNSWTALFSSQNAIYKNALWINPGDFDLDMKATIETLQTPNKLLVNFHLKARINVYKAPQEILRWLRDSQKNDLFDDDINQLVLDSKTRLRDFLQQEFTELEKKQSSDEQGIQQLLANALQKTMTEFFPALTLTLSFASFQTQPTPIEKLLKEFAERCQARQQELEEMQDKTRVAMSIAQLQDEQAAFQHNLDMQKLTREAERKQLETELRIANERANAEICKARLELQQQLKELRDKFRIQTKNSLPQPTSAIERIQDFFRRLFSFSTSKQKDFTVPELDMRLIHIPAGTFTIGSPESELGRKADEKQREFTIPRDFWLAETAVTQKQWRTVIGNNPSIFRHGDDYPVEHISWEAARYFCEELNARFGKHLPDGYCFSLPTEAQWEYACRAGSDYALPTLLDITTADGRCPNLAEVAWYDQNSNLATHPVTSKQPNVWGFYNMQGNVWEWCLDIYYDNYADADLNPCLGPVGPLTGKGRRIFRGGSWNCNAQFCRAANRDSNYPRSRGNYGLRVACIPCAK